MGEIIIRNKLFIQSMHNDIQCLSLSSATRPCDRCWFTSKQIQDWANMDRKTLKRRLDKLISVGRITGLKDDTTNNIIDIDNDDQTNDGNIKLKPLGSNLTLVENSINSDIIEFNLRHETGSKVTKLYNLNVLNHLAMVELDNEKLNTIANKFSDILSEVETTGQYNTQPVVPQTYLEALKALVASEEEKERLKLANDDLTQQVIDANEKLDQVNNENDNLHTELDLIRSTMFTNRRVCEMLRERFNIKYADSTLKGKTGKALKLISNELSENIIYRKDFVDGVIRSTPYYTERTVNRLIQRLEDNPTYLKSIK